MLQRITSKFKKKNKNSLETDAIPDYNGTNVGEREAATIGSDFEVTPSSLLQSSRNENAGLPDSNAARLVNPVAVPGAELTATTPFAHTYGHSPVINCPHSNSPVSIVINNASGFHVGDSITLSLSDNASVNLSTSAPGLGLSSLGLSLSRKFSKNNDATPNLEENVDVLSDKDITGIAQHLRDWKAFGRALTLSNSEIEETEKKFPGNPSDATFEMLQSFLTSYPDTSVGFIAAVLKEADEIKALEYLDKTRR